MLTANAMPEHIADAIAAGADLHLGKPFTAQSLFDAIAEAIAVGVADEELAA
jgi:CheY-like chemotaxis protein